MAEIVNIFSKEPTTPELASNVLAQLEATVAEFKDDLPMASYILIAVDSNSEISIRSSDMSRKDAFWLLSIAQDHAKHGSAED